MCADARGYGHRTKLVPDQSEAGVLLRQTGGPDVALPAEVRDGKVLYPWTSEPFSFQRRPHLESEVLVILIVGPEVHDEQSVLGLHVRGHQWWREILRC